jgi:anhydro-N-acetylmuramic acid kinase
MQGSTMTQLYIGVMSGTSLDGIDVVAVSFDPLTLHASLTMRFPDGLAEQLLALTQSGPDEIERMGVADVAYARVVGQSIDMLIDQYGLVRDDIVAIGCHGQTIRHRPQLGFSLQIGDPNLIAEMTRLPVVADFRRRDLAAGGQGAPLVPAFHQAVFQDPDVNKVILNLGGIANISVLPAGQPNAVYGFDTGPANILMDAWTQLHIGQPFDKAGQWAAGGRVIDTLLTQLLAHPFFAKPAPKSTGREDFHVGWLQDQITGLELAAQDVQATILALTAHSIAHAVLSTNLPNGELWLCGGGAFNHELWHQLQVRLPNWMLKSTADIGLAPTWVEATAFAWLAQQRIRGVAANIPSVTGASGYRVLGGLYIP